MIFRTLVKQYKFFRHEKYYWKKQVKKYYASMIGRGHSMQPKQGCFQVVPTMVNGMPENVSLTCPYYLDGSGCNQDCRFVNANNEHIKAVKKYERVKNTQLCIAKFIAKKVWRKICGKSK